MNSTIEHYQNEYQKLRESHQEPTWLRKKRDAAWQAFEDSGLPTKKIEEWKYNRLAELNKINFQSLGGKSAQPKASTLPLPKLDAYRLILVDGLIDEARSDSTALGKLVKISGIEKADEKDAVFTRVSQSKSASSNAFGHLNSALFNTGFILELPEGVILDKPLLLIHEFSSTATAAVHSKSIVRLGSRSQMTLIEAFLDKSDDARLFNATLTIELEASAILNQIKVQSNGQHDYHLVNSDIHQAKNSQYSLLSLAMGGKTARNDIKVVLNGEGAKTKLEGLYLLTNEDEADHHLLIEHKALNCQSLQNFKAILQEKSHGIFNGKVIVHPGADGTDAQQSNQNLLLSAQAEIDTKPELEIYADDVKCAHGATVGSLDEDALFFLRSRGIGEADAKKLLIAAFADEVIERVPNTLLRDALRDYVQKSLDDEEASL